MQENYAPKGYDKSEIITRTTARKTADGKEVYLATAKRCALDKEGTFGPYALLVVDGQEELEFRVLKQGDDARLRSEFRLMHHKLGNMTVDDLIDVLERKYHGL